MLGFINHEPNGLATTRRCWALLRANVTKCGADVALLRVFERKFCLVLPSGLMFLLNAVTLRVWYSLVVRALNNN